MTRYVLLNEDDVIEAGDEVLEWDPEDAYLWRPVAKRWIGDKVPPHITRRRGITSCYYCGHDPLSTRDE